MATPEATALLYAFPVEASCARGEAADQQEPSHRGLTRSPLNVARSHHSRNADTRSIGRLYPGHDSTGQARKIASTARRNQKRRQRAHVAATPTEESFIAW